MNDRTEHEQALPTRHNFPYDAPDAAALIEAVGHYLSEDLMARTEGPDRWLLRISANALAIAGREIALGPEHRASHGARLEALGLTSDRELAEAVRAGEMDERWDEVRDSIKATVSDSLSVANPGYPARG